MDVHAKFLPDDWSMVHISQPMTTMQEYNELLASRGFWEAMCDHVLIFQHDSLLLRHGIEEFLEWDFIGAPLYHIPFPAMNGGLSLRKRDAMLKVIDNFPYNGGNEDMFFCNGLQALNGNLPDKETAKKFSVETEFSLGSLGFHSPWKYLTPEEVEQIKHQYD